MYYQNGNYMQDLNCYNQIPNYGYNPYMQNNYQNMFNSQMPASQANLSAMYPSVYRIISPVVSKALSDNNRSGYLTEDILNDMVNTVYTVVEGDVNIVSNSGNTVRAENSSGNNMDRNQAASRQNTSNNSNSNTLLKDLIKIMFLDEISVRRQNPMMMQNPNQPIYTY